MDAPRQLAHGYTNETWAESHYVWKRYLGVDGDVRMRRELDALEAVQGALPVPAVVDVDLAARLVQFERLPCVPGQALVSQGLGPSVMFAAGQALSRLGALNLGFAHGDFGPQNLLLTSDGREVTGILDWEFCLPEEGALPDLAWAEWIIRMHHPEDVDSVRHLFAGFGWRPQWAERHQAMLSRCDWFIQRARRAGRPEAEGKWAERHQITCGWSDRTGT